MCTLISVVKCTCVGHSIRVAIVPVFVILPMLP